MSLLYLFLSKMGVFFRVLPLGFLLVFSVAMEERTTFIVRVQNDMKPAVFPSVEHWYSSTLRGLISSPLSRSEGGSGGGGEEGDPSEDFLHVYKTVFHGFSAEMSLAEAEEIKTRPQVLGVFPDRVHQLHTTRSPHFLGLNPQSNLLKESDYGSGRIIGFLDSGIWPERRSFHDQGLDPVPARWKGACKPGRGFDGRNCNKKIIGARYFGSGYQAAKGRINETTEYLSARDSDGHGTHTASTAAGRLVSNVSFQGYASGDAVGIAPKARIAVYKVCWPQGCFGSDILGALDKAVEDGVDVISLSVGASPAPMSFDPIAIGAFGAMTRGVFVSASAGNEGPGTMTVTNIAPWITTVAAGTIDRSFPADILLGNGKVISGVSVYGDGDFPAKRFFPLVYAWNGTGEDATFTAALCMKGGLKPEVVRGKIVLCDRGGIPRVTKGEAVKEAGGIGMILANGAPEKEGLISDAQVLPVVSIGERDGYEVHSYIQLAKVEARAAFVFHGTQIGARPAPAVAGFSSRGPNIDSYYIIKPDVVAPGVSILAAWSEGSSPTNLPSDKRRTEFNLLSGTSMACPHVSGMAALLKGMHPDWSPAAIRSALMTTAYVKDNAGKTMTDEGTQNPSSVWDMGSGHVDPEKAMDPGLVYDLTVEDYIQFLCSSNYSRKNIRIISRRPAKCSRKRGNPWDLNYPSISVVFANEEMAKEAVVRRTVTNVGGGPASYAATVSSPAGAAVRVEPAKLGFGEKGQKMSFVVRISAGNRTVGAGKSETSFGELTWTDGRHIVRSPIAVTWQQPF